MHNAIERVLLAMHYKMRQDMMSGTLFLAMGKLSTNRVDRLHLAAYWVDCAILQFHFKGVSGSEVI